MKRLYGIIIATMLAAGLINPVKAAVPVVHALMFYSPSCSHCEQVMTEVLPGLSKAFGENLQIGLIDTSGKGQAVYQAAISKFNLPSERQGIPMMIIGDTVLLGSAEIPEQFPALIEKGLAGGGIPWPDIPGFSEDGLTIYSPDKYVKTSLADKLQRDPLGNGLSIIVLVLMIVIALIEVIRKPWIAEQPKKKAVRKTWRKWTMPVLALAGLVVSGYLAYVELTLTQAFCGPIGDCNAVQQSEYARLFGVAPVAVLGLAGNLTILAVWAVKEYTKGKTVRWAAYGLMGLTSFGLLFSIYLTFLEPFVIGATCSWCLTSAIIMTGMFWVSFETAQDLKKQRTERHLSKKEHSVQ